MSTTPKEALMCSPCSSRQQQPSISDHGLSESWDSARSGSPRMATSQPTLRMDAAGVADVWGPMATLTALVWRAANNALGIRTSGGGQRQKRYDGAVGI